MSLHFSLAKKLIAHAKDLIRHIFNEAGHDAQALEKKFLEALKSHAADELEKVETKVGDTLQHWERAPDAANMTSPYAAPALPEEEEGEDEWPAEKPATGEAAPSDSLSDKGEETATDAGADTGAKDEDKGDEDKGEETKAADQTAPFAAPAGDAPTFGDKDAPEFEPKEATPPDTSVLPTEGAASVHGEPWPSSGIDSQAAADAGKDLGAGSELDLPKDEEKSGEEKPGEKKTEDADNVSSSFTPPKEATEAAGEDVAAEQADAPAIADGTVKIPDQEVDEDKKDA